MTNGVVRWHWHVTVLGGVVQFFDGQSSVGGSGINSTPTTNAGIGYCCGFENNSPIDGLQSITRSGSTLTIASQTPIWTDTDYGSQIVWVRLRLQKIR